MVDKISMSWKLYSNKNNDKEYIEILEKYKEYGYSTMTKLVAAALKENDEAHRNQLDVDNDNDNYKSII